MPNHTSRLRHVALILVAPVALSGFGCAMCCGPYDYHYPVFGGRIQRADPVNGRVGSVFSDPNLAGAGPLADSNRIIPESKAPPTDAERGTRTPEESPDASRGNLPEPDTSTNPLQNPAGSDGSQPPAESKPLIQPPSESVPGDDRATSNRWRPGARDGRYLQR